MFRGWAVVKLLDDTERTREREALFETIKKSPEFIPGLPDGHKFAKTGFATLGAASSFHNMTVRVLRSRADTHLKPMLLALAKKRGQTYVEMIVDRIMIRQPGQAPTRETWHRDESADALPRDVMLGGWINLNNFDEFLSAVPSTHLPVNLLRGFGAVKEPELSRVKPNATKIKVPPGHILVFFENMIHEVLANPARAMQVRLFTGWRLTTTATQYFKDIDSRLSTLDVDDDLRHRVADLLETCDATRYGATQRSGELGQEAPAVLNQVIVAMKAGRRFR